MVKTAEMLEKYIEILEKLNKQFPKGKTVEGFTIDISFGGNNEVDIHRLCIGGVASDPELGNKFLELLIQSTKDNIQLWRTFAEKDMEEIKNALDKLLDDKHVK